MYSKAEAKKLREDFWTSFGKSFPRKWTLYDTKIKDFSFKFSFDLKKARVLIAIEDSDKEKRALYYNKMLSVKNILQTDFLPDAIYEEHLKTGVSIHNKATWQEVMVFLNDGMAQIEAFWAEYKDIIVENDEF